MINEQWYIDYVDYFKLIATNHIKIQHTSTSDYELGFVRISLQEAFLGYQRKDWKIGSLVLELIDPTTRLTHLEGGIQYRTLQGGFQIVGHHIDGDNDSQIKIMTEAEITATDIITRMRYNSRGGHPLWSRSFDAGQDVTYSFITYNNDGNWAGVRVLFDFRTKHDVCIYNNRWNDDVLNDEFINNDDLECIK